MGPIRQSEVSVPSIEYRKGVTGASMIGRRLGLCWTILCCLLGPLVAGCAQTSLSSAYPASQGLTKPDRVLVFDFAVTPADAQIERRSGSAPQTEEDVQAGRALARALSASLVSELRRRGIDAYHASQTDPPGETTASVRGAFLRTDGSVGGSNVPVGFTLRGGQVRTRIQVVQGTGLKLQNVGEGETVTPSGLKPGNVGDAAVNADAQRTADLLAERIAGYYRREGWIK
jgi:hypothetical protein